jgi:hypothetical protein
MDCELGSIVAHDRDNLKKRSTPRGAQIQAGVVVLILDRHGVLYSVVDIRLGNTVLDRRRMDLH